MTPVFHVEEYVQQNGVIPYKLWFDSLDPQAAAKVATATLRLSMGNTSRVKWFSSLGECVIADIDKAKRLLAEYKARKSTLAKRKK